MGRHGYFYHDQGNALHREAEGTEKGQRNKIQEIAASLRSSQRQQGLLILTRHILLSSHLYCHCERSEAISSVGLIYLPLAFLWIFSVTLCAVLICLLFLN